MLLFFTARYLALFLSLSSWNPFRSSISLSAHRLPILFTRPLYSDSLYSFLLSWESIYSHSHPEELEWPAKVNETCNYEASLGGNIKWKVQKESGKWRSLTGDFHSGYAHRPRARQGGEWTFMMRFFRHLFQFSRYYKQSESERVNAVRDFCFSWCYVLLLNGMYDFSYSRY